MSTSSPILKIQNLNKGFGGVTATDNITLDILPSETHAIIGPNGAGKTTLISQISGLLSPDSGSMHFHGQDITHADAPTRALRGLARSFQITSVFMSMSVLENVTLAVQAHQGHSFSFWKSSKTDETLIMPAMAMLEKVGLEARADNLAAMLSHGERRQLEIAMVLATNPTLILLDEPMAGMGPEESLRMIETLRQLEDDITMLLVEHDMDAVFALADRISVLVYGRIIATDTPENIRDNDAVKRAYLGESM